MSSEKQKKAEQNVLFNEIPNVRLLIFSSDFHDTAEKVCYNEKNSLCKGGNAVENLIPRWYRELELFRGVKPLLVLEGCVMDQVRDTRNTDESWLDQIALREAVDKLSPREQRILAMRFYDGKTQMEVSGEIGISQAQVSRLEKNAISTIRRNL